MVDRLTPERRSALMANVRSKNTSPEIRVRKAAHALGYRFRLHRKDLPGHPDLVFPGRKKIVFVHGCFWHRHPGCNKATTPKSHVKYWKDKFRKNVARDKATEKALRELGWDVLVIWECQTKHVEELSEKLSVFLG